MNQKLKIDLTLSETKTIWELLTGENYRIKMKLEKAPQKLDYWIEKKSEVEDLLNRFNNHFKIEEHEEENQNV